MNHTNQCCCKGEYPNLEHHTPEKCWTEMGVDEAGIVDSKLWAMLETNKPTKEVGKSSRCTLTDASSIPSPQEKKPFKESLRDLIEIQSAQDATDPYMVGMANGLICAWSVLTGEEPKYMSNEKTGQYATRSTPKLMTGHTPIFRDSSGFEMASPTTQRSTTGDKKCERCGRTSGVVDMKNCPFCSAAPHQETEEVEQLSAILHDIYQKEYY